MSILEIMNATHEAMTLRLALDILEGEMPGQWHTASVRHTLKTLRDKIDELGLEQLRRLGPQQEYLIITPLPQGTSDTLAEMAAAHIRALDDLGVVLRLV